MAGAIQDNLFIGRRAQELRGLLKIKYPMEHGIVMDWDDMERIWGWVYSDGLKALSEEVSLHPRWSVVYQKLRSAASCPLDGSSVESTAESRRRRPDLF
jgi:centractin